MTVRAVVPLPGKWNILPLALLCLWQLICGFLAGAAAVSCVFAMGAVRSDSRTALMRVLAHRRVALRTIRQWFLAG